MANYKAKGRPELPDGEKLSEIIQFRMTAEERQRCEAAAENAGQKFSAWIRDAMLMAAKRKARR